MNLVRTELSIKPVEGWLVANTLRPINDKATNSSSVCSDSISCKSEVNDTCVGEPEYCNLTEVEYLEMLYDYIFPTPGEWVLIGFHAAVFLVGLVSFLIFYSLYLLISRKIHGSSCWIAECAAGFYPLFIARQFPHNDTTLRYTQTECDIELYISFKVILLPQIWLKCPAKQQMAFTSN